MAMSQRLISARFPYLTIQFEASHTKQEVEAFFDSGFDGDLAVPQALIANGDPPDGHQIWHLADGSEVLVSYHLGMVSLGQLGSFEAVIVTLGDEPLIGRGITNRFTVILDHGRRLIVEP
jgi:hypothetical protein